MSDALTKEDLIEAMPAHIRKTVDDSLVAAVNGAMADPEALSVFRENIIGFASVMKEGKFKMESYLNAVGFVSYSLLGDNNITAWSKVFRTRFNDMQKAGRPRTEIASVCSRYANSKLVVLLKAQSMMPTHIVNAPLYQEALNKQASIMRNDDASFKVQSEAANYLMTALKPPEIKKIELDIAVVEDETLSLLRATTMELAMHQRAQIVAGTQSPKAVAASVVIPVQVERDAPDE